MKMRFLFEASRSNGDVFRFEFGLSLGALIWLLRYIA